MSPRGTFAAPEYEIQLLADSKARIVGMETGALTVLSWKTPYLALKEAGHTYWNGIGSRGYAPPCVMVYHVINTLTHDRVVGIRVLEWDVGRKRNE